MDFLVFVLAAIGVLCLLYAFSPAFAERVDELKARLFGPRA